MPKNGLATSQFIPASRFCRMDRIFTKRTLPMKKSIAIAVLGLISIGLAQQAAAYTVTPQGPFTASGPISITDPLGNTVNCTLSVSGRVLPTSKPKVFTAALSGSDAACGNTTTVYDTPWMWAAVNATQLNFPHFGINTLNGSCLAMVHINASSSGVLSVSNRPVGACKVSFTLQANPVFTIAP
jgi:hypothetical protein